jgi:5-hydroxyisourate hydrolase
VSISTHVLDASEGTPAPGISVALSRRLPGPAGGWLDLELGVTDSGGRLRFDAVTPGGVYRLVFATGPYFAARSVTAFYPEVTITFTVTDGHYHVPLLLSPFAYSTYRGS